MVKASRRWRLHHHVLARPTGVFGPADDQNPELGRDDVEPFGPVFADDMQHATTARTAPVLDVDQHLEAPYLEHFRSYLKAKNPIAALTVTRWRSFA